MNFIVIAQGPGGNQTYLVIFLVLFIAVVALFAFILFAKYFNLWIQAKTTHANVGLLELISELSRLISFTFRLFGNVFAGEVLLTMMGFLVPLVLIDVFYGLELFVGAIQAFVFAMLTLIFAQTAMASHGGDHEEAHEAGH